MCINLKSDYNIQTASEDIEVLKLDTRYKNALKRSGVQHVSTLAMMTTAQVRDIRNIGSKGFSQICAAMKTDVGIPLCIDIDESKRRFKDRYGDIDFKQEYLTNNLTDDVIFISISEDIENSVITFSISENKTDRNGKMVFVNHDVTLTIEQILIIHNWNRNPYLWDTFVMCGDNVLNIPYFI